MQSPPFSLLKKEWDCSKNAKLSHRLLLSSINKRQFTSPPQASCPQPHHLSNVVKLKSTAWRETLFFIYSSATHFTETSSTAIRKKNIHSFPLYASTTLNSFLKSGSWWSKWCFPTLKQHSRLLNRSMWDVRLWTLTPFLAWCQYACMHNEFWSHFPFLTLDL